MTPPGWLTSWLADVPAGESWLSERERAALAGLSPEKRRVEWRLGRWAAKQASAVWASVEVEVLTDPDGAPRLEPPVAHLSLSHREGRALAVVAAEPVGCDLETGDRPEWAVREAAAKLRRDGSVREQSVQKGTDPFATWEPWEVTREGVAVTVWCRREPGWTLAVTGERPPEALETG